MADLSHTNPVPSKDDTGKQPKPATDRAISPSDPAEGANLPPEERGGPAAD